MLICKPVKTKTVKLVAAAALLSKQTNSMQGMRKGSIIRAVYFFALLLELEEIDMLRGGQLHDLSGETAQEHWLDKLHLFQVVLCTPPCSSFSRVV